MLHVWPIAHWSEAIVDARRRRFQSTWCDLSGQRTLDNKKIKKKTIERGTGSYLVSTSLACLSTSSGLVLLGFTEFSPRCRVALLGLDRVGRSFERPLPGFYLVFSGLIKPYQPVLGFEITTGFFCIV